MRPSPRVLVVSSSHERRELLQRWLVSASYEVQLAAEFREARHHLEVASPDLLVADVKLQAYNGLHLAIWSRGRRLRTKALLIGEPDPVLQKEADRERAAYVSPPLDEHSFLAIVTDLLASYRPARRSPRKRVELDAVVDGVSASVVDLSYEGLCLALPNADAIALPPFFTLHVPAHDMSCRVQRVWTGRPTTLRGTLLCGAVLPVPDTAAAMAWRVLVDAVPGRPSIAAESAG